MFARPALGLGERRHLRFLLARRVGGAARLAEELCAARLDGELDPSVDELTEGFVVPETLSEFLDAVFANEPTARLAPVAVGQLVVWAVLLRVDRIVASARGSAADVVLLRDAAWVDWSEFKQFFLDTRDFLFQSLELAFLFHARYFSADIGQCQAQRNILDDRQ